MHLGVLCLISPEQATHVRNAPGYRGGGHHCRTHEMCARAFALPPLEIAVRGRSAAQTRWHGIAVHRGTTGTAGSAPFETGLAKDAVESFRLCLPLDRRGTR